MMWFFFFWRNEHLGPDMSFLPAVAHFIREKDLIVFIYTCIYLQLNTKRLFLFLLSFETVKLYIL